jgi:hypothetical protein
VRVAFFWVLLLAVSCKPHSELIYEDEMLELIPDSIIGPDKMAAILMDVHLAEATVQETASDSVRMQKDKILAGYYGYILELHGENQEHFVQSYRYYEAHPLILNRVYQQVIEDLSLLERKYK